MHKTRTWPVFVILCCLSIVTSTPFSAFASERLQQKLLPGSQKLGSGILTYFGWSIYEASLYSNNKAFAYDHPFLLTLHYHLPVRGQKIAKQSIDEIRALGFQDEYRLAVWYAQMRNIFPDVAKGARLTGLYHPQNGAQFYHGKKLIGEIRDPDFANWFFNIWLGEKTKLPSLRRELLGHK